MALYYVRIIKSRKFTFGGEILMRKYLHSIVLWHKICYDEGGQTRYAGKGVAATIKRGRDGGFMNSNERHERFLRKLAEIAKEYEEPLKGEARLQSRLRWEDWAALGRETVAFARSEVRRRKWRGRRGGVLPGGVSGEDVAEEAIQVVLSGKARLVLGFTREKVVNELRRLVSQRVRLLHRLKEAGSTRSEWELLPKDETGERVSVFSLMEGNGGNGAEAAERREEERQKAQVRKRIEESLGGDRVLKGIFGCLCAGMVSPKEIGRKLGLSEAEVVAGRSRLERRLAAHRRSR